MARLPDEVVERIKREISVQRLAEARGIKLRRSGKELIGLCPFHRDTSPSLNIDPVKNQWHCKGACGAGGSVIDWVMRAEGISFRHAMELLKRDYLSSAASAGGPPPKKCTVPKLPPLFEPTADDRKVLGIVANYYHETLKNSPDSPKAQQYLFRRGLQSAEMIEHFRLGYSNRTLNYHLPDKNRAIGAEIRGRLEALGILREKTGHEHFNGSVVIPIFNLEGEVMQMYGRKVTRITALRDASAHLYLTGPRRGVWNEEALIASKEIILCEALIDALTFWCAGFRHVTTSYGVNGFTDEHRAAFKKHGTKKIYIAYDRDEAGERAAQAHGEELMQMGMECFRVKFPRDQDANEFALKNQPAAKFLGMYLNNAEWLGKGKRPTVTVIESAAPAIPISIEEDTIKPAAKEKITEAITTPAEEKITEPVFSLAAETEEPVTTTEATKEKISETNEAQAVLPSPLVDVPVEIVGEEIRITLGDRRYRVLGLEKNTAVNTLQINLLVTRGESLHVDNFNLYAARNRMIYSKQAAEELGVKEEVVTRDLQKVLRELERLKHQIMQKALAPKEEEAQLSAEERAEALALLRDPRLLDRVLEDFERCGVVGEETNKRISYLAAVSRLLEKPLAIVVQSASAAGKSSLMDAVLDFMPEEQREEYSAMTGQALFYMGQKNLKHKILAVSEEEGASRAAYALKLLQSEGVLKIASTGKDPVSGKLVTHEYVVEGPVMLFLTTTAQEVDEELLNRTIVLTVNEEREQTRAIHRKQREAHTTEGLWAKRKWAKIVRLHRNAQRLLRPLAVANNHEEEEDFPDHLTRTRRDHMKLLTLIEAIALLHQHQRQIKTETRDGETLEYIEATMEDVKLARQLMRQVLMPSLDELPPHTRRLLARIEEMVEQECERQQIETSEYCFTRRTVRQHTLWGDTQLRLHLRRLEEMEYLMVRRGGGQGQLYVYQLRCDYDAHFAGSEGNFAGTSRGLRGGAETEGSPVKMRPGRETSRFSENTYKENEKENRIVAVPPVPVKPNGGLAAGAK